jgi:WD40 repeat protein
MAQRRRNRWLRGFVLTLSGSLFAMVIGCGVVVLLAVGVRQARDQARQQEQIAKDQAEKAKQQEQIAFTRRLAAQVVADEGTDIDTSLLLGLEASRLGQTRDVQGGVMAGLVNTARLKTSLRGHFSEVSAVAFNPAGTLLASAGADHQVLIWDAKTYTLLHTLIGHTDQVFQVTFSPTDPTTLISVGDDSTIRLWNAATGEVQQHFSYTGSLSDIAVSSDGKRVVGVGCAEHDAQKVCSKGKVSLWQLGGDTSPQTLTGGESLLREVAFNPAKPDELVTGGDDGSVLLWNLSDGSSKPYAYTNYTSPIYAVAFSPNGLHIAWANRSGTLFIRSLETDVATVALPPIQASTTSILSIAFSADGNQVASTGYDRSIQFWRVADGQKLQTLSVVHGAAIDALAFSSDGSMLASASRDHTVRIWNMRGAYDYGVGQELGGYARSELAFNADGSRLAIGNWQEVALWNGQTLQPLNQSLKGHTAWVEAVAFNPAPDRAELLAAGGADGELFIWNTINNTVQYTLTRHQVEIRRVAFAPDGRQLVSADESGKVLLWDVDSGMLLRELQGHRDYVGSLAFSADGLLLASGSCGQRRADRSCSQGEIRVWRLVDGQQLGEPLANHTDWVNDLAFAPNAPILASGSRDKSVMLWDVAPDGTIRLRDVLNGHTNTVLNVQFTPDGQRLASGGWDRVIKLWRVSDGTLEQELPAKHQSPVLNLVFRPGSDELITTGQAGEMLRWRYTAEQEQPEAIFAGDDLYTVYAVAFSPHPKHGLLASAGRDWNVNFWNAQTGQWRYALKHQAPVRAVAFSSDGKQLVSGSEDYSVRLWNIDYDNFYNSSEVLSMTTHTNWVLSVAFSPDNTLIASGSADDSVILWRAENGEVVHHFDDISGYGDINSVAFSPDGALLAAGTDFGNILIWNVATKERVARLSGHDNAVLTLAFNPEQPTMLASGGLDGIVTIWDVARKRRDGVVLNGHTDSVFSVVFNQAGTMLATGSRDRSIALWDIATRQIIGTRLEGHRDVVRSLAFSSDDNMLVSGAELSPIMVWNVGTDWWRAEACRRAGRSLTWNEWQQYMGDEPYRATCPDTALPLSQQIVQAHTHAQAGDGVRAREMFATISTAVVQLASPLLNNQVCWQGALSDAAEVVLPACDKAVALAQQLELSAAWYQDSRGVARALAGDLAGARADFEAYVQWTQSQEDNGSYEQQGRRREQWIKIIDEEQRNPIDAETLADLEFDRLGDWLPDNQYGASR